MLYKNQTSVVVGAVLLLPRSLKRNPAKALKINYRFTETGPKNEENTDKLNRAFKILFDEMLRQGKIKFKKYPQRLLDN